MADVVISPVMSYAIISLAGRQFLVKEGDLLKTTRQVAPSAKVLFYKEGDKTEVGRPYLDQVNVELEKIEDKKDRKVVVARFKAKSRHRRKIGHRQNVSIFRIKGIFREHESMAKKSARATVKSEAAVVVKGERG